MSGLFRQVLAGVSQGAKLKRTEVYDDPFVRNSPVTLHWKVMRPKAVPDFDNHIVTWIPTGGSDCGTHRSPSGEFKIASASVLAKMRSSIPSNHL